MQTPKKVSHLNDVDSEDVEAVKLLPNVQEENDKERFIDLWHSHLEQIKIVS